MSGILKKMPAVFFEKKDEEKIMIPERLAALREKMRATAWTLIWFRPPITMNLNM